MLNGYDFGRIGAASNIAIGTNPPYGSADFLAMYPKFGTGPAFIATGNLTNGSPVVSPIDPVPVLAVGQLVAGPGIPAGTTIVAIQTGYGSGSYGDGGFGQNAAIVLSQNATMDATGATLAITSSVIPMAVINSYIALASASLMQARWQEMWAIAMALFIAHYCTLYLSSEGNPGSTPGQIALSGIEKGLTVSKSVGPVSVSKEMLDGLEDYGSFRETTYGVQFVTMTKAVGSGGMLLW